MKYISADLGNGTSTTCILDPDTLDISTSFIVSAFVEKENYIRVNSYGGADAQEDLSKIKFDGQETIYGVDALRQIVRSNPQPLGAVRYLQSRLMRQLLYACLAENEAAHSFEDEKVSLIMSIPPNHIFTDQEKKHNPIVKKALQDAYLGSHEICYRNGGDWKTLSLNITSLKITGEGIGGYYNAILTDGFRYNENNGRGILVLDIGRGTLDALIIKSGQVIDGSVSSVQLGADSVFSTARDIIDKMNPGQRVIKEDLERFHLTGVTYYDYTDEMYKRAMSKALEKYLVRYSAHLSSIAQDFLGDIGLVVITGGFTKLLSCHRNKKNLLSLTETSFRLDADPIVLDEKANAYGIAKMMGAAVIGELQ